MIKRKKVLLILSISTVLFAFMFSILKSNTSDLKGRTLLTNANTTLSNKKICWGIKRNPNHQQPDVGAANKKLLDKYNGICLGDSESKKVYLTFDSRI